MMKAKSVLLSLGVIILSISMVSDGWAIRDPNQPIPHRQKQSPKAASSTSVNSPAVDISAPRAPQPVVDITLRKHEIKQGPRSIKRDFRDSYMLPAFLAGNLKTEEEISTVILNQLKGLPNWLGGVAVSDLRLDYIEIIPSIDGRAQDAYVHFVQQNRGVDIEGTEVTFLLKIFPDKTLIASAKAFLYPTLQLKSNSLRALARVKDTSNEKSLQLLGLEGKPVNKKRDQQKIRFIEGAWHRVSEIQYEESPYQAVMDEDSDQNWVEDKRLYATIQGSISGRGVEFDPLTTGSKLKVLKLSNLRLTSAEGANVFSDLLGNFDFVTVTKQTTITSSLRGRWARVLSAKKDNLFLTNTGVPGTLLNLRFNPSGSAESETAQVNAYYHVNFIHDWVQSHLSSKTLAAINIPIITNVNINDVCNAYYDYKSLNFFASGDGCLNSAYDTIIYHEYGHFVDDKIGGITDGGLSEGWGDVLGAYATGQPILGEGFFGVPGESIRRADNNYQYPRGGQDEIHALGQAWVGFAWNLRENLITSLGKTAGIQTAENIVIPTLYANSKDIPAAVRDVMVRDDDDGNLLNGTPHYAEIAAAAIKHHLPFPEPDVISPAPITDLHIKSQTAESIILGWTATGDDGLVGTADAYDIRYSFSPIQTEEDFAAATPVQNDIDSPVVPAESGKPDSMPFKKLIVNKTYYFAMKVLDNMQNASTLSNMATTIIKAKILLSENFESGAKGWQSNGLWHLSGKRFKSPKKSFVYNNGVDFKTPQDFNSGSLITPLIKIPDSADQLVIDSQQWVDTAENGWDDTTQTISISADNGATWDEQYIFTLADDYRTWKQKSVVFSGYAGKTVKVRFFFEAYDPDTSSGEGWYLDDVNISVTQPPVLTPIGNKGVTVGQTLTFKVKGTDPNGEPLIYSVNGLPSGASFENQVFFWIPDASQAGTYSVRFSVSNGFVKSERISIVVANKFSDLTVNVITPAADTAVIGLPMRFSYSVKNLGPGPAPISQTAVHLSKDAKYGGKDDIGLTLYSVSALAKGQVLSLSNLSFEIPDTTPLGDYYLCAMADYANVVVEQDKINNTKCSSTTIRVTGSDLVIKTLSGPTIGYLGDTVILNYKVTNRGTAASKSFEVGFYFSADAKISADEDELVGTRSIASLAVGASSSGTVSVTLPPDWDRGKYYWGAIVDYTETRPEANERNNTLAGNAFTLKPGADFTIIWVTGPTSAKLNQTISINMLVRNQGVSSADGSFLAFYLSKDTNITFDDIFMGNTSVGVLPAGGFKLITATFSLRDIPRGTYYIGAYIDDFNYVAEIDDNNNTQYGPRIVIK